MMPQCCSNKVSAGANRILKEEQGAVIILAIFVFVILFAFAGLAVDAGNLYRAQIQLQKAADTAALAGPAATVLTPRTAVAPATPMPVPNSVVQKYMCSVLRQNLAMNGLDNTGDTTCGAGNLLVNFHQNPVAPDTLPNHALVNARTTVRFNLMQLVPFFQVGAGMTDKNLLLSAAAQAQRPSANIALMLDISDSMQCPSGTCKCLCQQPGGDPAVPSAPHNCQLAAAAGACGSAAGRQKYQDLQDAVRAFIDMFDPLYDRISLIPFNITSKVWNTDPATGLEGLRDRAAGANSMGFDRNNLVSAIGFNAAGNPSCAAGACNPATNYCFMQKDCMGSNTNPSDAFFRAYKNMVDRHIIDRPYVTGSNVNQDEEASYLLFTDGAPDAARFLLSDRSTIPKSYEHSLGWDYDYTEYTLQWVYAPVGTSSLGGDFAAPGRFVESQVLNLGGQAVYPNGTYAGAGGVQVNANPDCSEDYRARFCRTGTTCDSATVHPILYIPPCTPPTCIPAPPSSWKFNGVFTTGATNPSPCVANLGFVMPKVSDPQFQENKKYGFDYDGATTPYFDWRQQHYNVTVAASDFVRNHSGMVYVIGLGPLNPAAPSNNAAANVYQGVDDMLYRKDLFLTRVADDFEKHYQTGNGNDNFTFAMKDGTSPPTHIPTWAELTNTNKRGTYMATPDSTELTNLFVQMALKIRMRLIK